MKIQITRHNGGENTFVGTLEISGHDADQVAAVADSDGLPDLVAMADHVNMPPSYDWTGDEVYEILDA